MWLADLCVIPDLLNSKERLTVDILRSTRVWAIVVAMALSCSGSVDALHKTPLVAPADASRPLLVFDVAEEYHTGLPRNFRTTNDSLPAENKPNTAGLADLHASGSGQFTAEGLKAVLARLGGQVTVFDLRQESHMIVNGLPVSWYATNNWANVGRAPFEIETSEEAEVQSIKKGEMLSVADTDAGQEDSNIKPPEKIKIETAMTERDCVTLSGAKYVRLMVTDHAYALDEEVDRFILAIRLLPKDGWVYFHCRAGRGRTTTFMTLYDMLRNASKVSLEDIAQRQKLLSGDYDVLKLDETGSWKAPYILDRIAFIRAFYEYARANPGGSPQLWTEWLKLGQ
jgi:hypothetical protein